jgi:hypothetical protein
MASFGLWLSSVHRGRWLDQGSIIEYRRSRRVRARRVKIRRLQAGSGIREACGRPPNGEGVTDQPALKPLPRNGAAEPPNRDGAQRADDVEESRDPIDVALEDTFPASDALPWWGGHHEE